MARIARFVPLGALVLVTMIIAGCAATGGGGAAWTPLYNGRDLSGWEEVGDSKGTWSAHGDVLACKGGGHGWLSTVEQFGDFDLDLEFKIPPDGNSGVFVRAPREGNPWEAGMEIQVLDDDTTVFGKLKDCQHTGSIYCTVPPSKPAQKKAGEWNHYAIRCRGPRVTVVLNGETVADASMDEVPGLKARPRSGYVGLQNHGSGVEYRRIQIRRL